MENRILTFWNRLINLLLWGAVVFLIVAYTIPDRSARIPAIVVLCLFYLVYLISAFCSPSFRYLLHYSDVALIYDYMQRLFYTPARLVMHIVCYHYETREVTEKDAQGNTQVRSESVKVETHRAESQFFYTSWRDVSGVFTLNTEGAMVDMRRAFVKLALVLDMQFAEDGTIQDYEQQRVSFVQHNTKDMYQDYTQQSILDGMQPRILVRVSDFRPKYLGAGWFAACAVLGLIEVYKLHMDRYCVEQDFTVRKVVSTRRNLAAMPEYAGMVPQIKYLGEVRTYAEPIAQAEAQQPLIENAEPLGQKVA